VGSVVGVDVSLGRGLDVVLLDGRTVKETWSRLGSTNLGELLRELRPDAVAIDAPPRPGLGLLRDPDEAARLDVPPRPGTHTGRRVAEYELSRRGIGSHQTHFEETRLFSWMTAGFEVFEAAAAAGYPPFLGVGAIHHMALEVFPYASYVALCGCLSPGRRWRLAWRRAVLAGTDLSGLPEDAGIDVVDAACAALTGARFLEGGGSLVGDPREGVIVLPVKRLEDRYHRCAPPGDGAVHTARAVTTPRLCECGCGDPVKRRFLPGHDAKLKSRLLREVRAGQAARERLVRLGWSATASRGEEG
jgi:predicted nuclease with RNAse H fold